VENYRNILILRNSAGERGGMAEFASRLIGKREVIRSQLSHSRPKRIGGGLLQSASAHPSLELGENWEVF
jgi:hypothetical protein